MKKKPTSEIFFEPSHKCPIAFHHIVIFVTVLIISCLLSGVVGWECCTRQYQTLEKELSAIKHELKK